MKRMHYIMAVWGEDFTEFFLTYSLPNQLSANNLKACRFNEASCYQIYTTRKYAEMINSHASIDRLRKLICVNIHVLDSCGEQYLEVKGPHEAMNAFHRHAINCAAENNAYLVFLAPDALISDGTLPALERYASDGKQCVLVSGIRTVKENIVYQLSAWPRSEGGDLSFCGRDLVDLLLQHPHPTTSALFWEEETFSNNWPSQLYWRVSDKAILAHCWHLHPIMIKAHPGIANTHSTIDGAYLDQAIVDQSLAHIVTDSDEICVIEASKYDHGRENYVNTAPPDIESNLLWISLHTRPIHRHFFSRGLLFRGTGCQSGDFDNTADRAKQIVDRLLADSRLSLADRVINDFEELRDYGKIFVFGAGNAGRQFRRLAEDNQMMVAGFVDSNRTGWVDGLPLIHINNLRDHISEGDAVIVVSQYRREIYKNLRDLKIEPVLDGLEVYQKLANSGGESGSILQWSAGAG